MLDAKQVEIILNPKHNDLFWVHYMVILRGEVGGKLDTTYLAIQSAIKSGAMLPFFEMIDGVAVPKLESLLFHTVNSEVAVTHVGGSLSVTVEAGNATFSKFELSGENLPTNAAATPEDRICIFEVLYAAICGCATYTEFDELATLLTEWSIAGKDSNTELKECRLLEGEGEITLNLTALQILRLRQTTSAWISFL